MNLEMNQISSEYLNRLIKELEQKINVDKSMQFKHYSTDDFKHVSLNEITLLFETCGLENPSFYAEKVFDYFASNRYLSQEKPTLFRTRTFTEKDMINEIILNLNRKIKNLRINIEIEIKQLEFLKETYEKLLKYLYEKSYITDNEYEEIANLIFSLGLSDEDKFKLSTLIAEKIITDKNPLIEEIPSSTIEFFNQELKLNEDNVISQNTVSVEIENSTTTDITQEESIELEPQEIDLEQFLERNGISKEEYERYSSFAKGMFMKYTSDKSIHSDILRKSNFQVSNIEKILEMISTMEELTMIIDSEDLTFDDFSLVILSTIANILNFESNNVLQSYQKLQEIDFQYMNYLKKKDAFLNTARQLFEKANKTIEELNKNKQFDEYGEKVIEISQSIKKIIDDLELHIISETSFTTFNKIINLLNEELTSIIDLIENKPSYEEPSQPTTSQKTNIKSFVLFEGAHVFELDKFIPYILLDLDPKNQHCLIDTVLLNEKKPKEDYREEISKLITDLLIYDKPETAANSNSSVQKTKNNTVDFILYDKNDREPKNRTGMRRIRPSISSHVRFAERRIVISKNSTAFEQVTSIIKKYLPNVEINPDNDFSIFVNIASAFKTKDEKLYSTSIKRYNNNNSQILALFYKDNKYIKPNNSSVTLKEALSSIDCQLLENVILNSIEVYDRLRELDPRFNFDLIDSMRGSKKYEL